MPEYARDMVVVPATTDCIDAKIVFSALHNEIAKDLEPQFAQAGAAVCSNASSYRRGEDVPLLLPEINADHIQLVKHQRQQQGWSGCIVTNPNCTSTGLTIALKALGRCVRCEESLCCFASGAFGRGLSRHLFARYHGQRHSQCRAMAAKRKKWNGSRVRCLAN